MTSRRAYAHAVGWIESTCEPSARRTSTVLVFGGCFAAGLALLGLFAIASPEELGQKGADVLNLGWPSTALVGLIVIGLGGLFALRRRIADLATSNLRPFAPRYGEQEAFDQAVNALASCPAPMRIRFAAARVWLPAAGACVGALLSVSAAYFLIYAVLARFDIGGEMAIAAVGDVVLGLGVLALSGRRIATMRLASGVLRRVSPLYLT